MYVYGFVLTEKLVEDQFTKFGNIVDVKIEKAKRSEQKQPQKKFFVCLFGCQCFCCVSNEGGLLSNTYLLRYIRAHQTMARGPHAAREIGSSVTPRCSTNTLKYSDAVNYRLSGIHEIGLGPVNKLR